MEKLTPAQINAWRIISKSGLDSFTSVSLSTKEQKISGNTLSSLAKKGLLTKMTNSSPILYSINMEVMASMGLKLEENKIMREENISLKERNEVLDILKNIDLDVELKSKIERLLNKKQGLSFDEYKEEVEYQLQDDEGILVLSKKDEIIQDKNLKNNFLLEGDNLASLTLLQQNYKNKINCIYIDPPYNTLNKEFIYNDKMIGEDDMYRHSKWLSFMKKRLTIAKDLLTDDGVIFISIDDNEQANLKLLCDEIFGEKNFIDNFIWEKNPNPTFLNKYSRSSCEYILSYSKNKNSLLMLDGGIVESTETDAPLQNKGNPKRTILVKAGMAKFNFADTSIAAGNYGLNEILDNFNIVNGTNETDFRMSGTYRMTQDTLYQRINDGEVLLFKTNRMAPRLSYTANKNHTAPLKFLDSDKYGTNQTGNNELKNILSKYVEFSYPKPSSLIKKLINFVPNNKDAIILDFFAGSGTTGQAVAELNLKDGGNRQFILCTNNENNICENVTFPRNKTVITGIRPDGTQYSDGLLANLQYYKVDIMTDENYDEDILTDSKEYEIQLKMGTNKIAFVYTIQQLEQVLDNIEDYEIIGLGENIILNNSEKELLEQKNIQIIELR